jgi:hypothetical protein
MHLRTSLFAIAAAAVAIAPAFADQKVVQVTTIKSPGQESMLKRLSPEERAEVAKQGFGRPIQSVYYVSGSHVRVDTSGYTILIDNGKKTQTVVNRATHRYVTRPFDPNTVSGDNAQASVKNTGKSKNLLGHRTTLYQVVLQNVGTPGTTTADIWAAPDLPRPETINITGPAASMMGALHKINGMPLLVTVHAVSAYGPIDVRSVVKSISTSRLPASVFKIPAGSKPAPAGAGVGAPPIFGRPGA